jgi:hypothetical protein
MTTTNSEIIYNWNCNTVDVYPKNGEYTDVVYNVHYAVWGTDGSEASIQANIIGTQILDIKNITDFIPFNELTSEQTVAWTKSTMGEERVLEIENNIAEQIALLKNPVSITLVVPDPPRDAPPTI